MANNKGLSWLGVLGILAILFVVAAVMYPMFVPCCPPAQKTSCLSNLKQLGTAINMYTNDWNEKYPLTLPGGMFSVPALNRNTTLWGASPSGFTDWTWGTNTIQDQLTPYVKNMKIFICPEVGSKGTWYVNRKTTIRVSDNHSAKSSFATSYIFNGWCLKSADKKPAADGSNEIQISGQSEDICKQPADAAIMWDMVSGFRPRRGSNAQTAHEDCINVLYADGHAKTVVMRENTAPWNNKKASYNGHFWGASFDSNFDGKIDASDSTYGSFGWY